LGDAQVFARHNKNNFFVLAMNRLRNWVALLVAGVLSVPVLHAQAIRGAVLDPSNAPASFATITLHTAKDSALVKGTVSGDDGAFDFRGIAEGRYFAKASLIGMGEYSTEAFDFEGGEKTLETMVLAQKAQELKQVTIISRRLPVEVKADKTILNVEGSVNSTGLSALELLRKAPGVTVDNNDNINVKGKNNVRILIDGREQPLDGKDLAALLKGTQAADIATIEIISNPSAKYDASGNAGIINIRLKKNKSYGTNGNIGVEGIYGETAKGGVNLSLNNRSKRANVFGSYNNHYGDWHNTNSFVRKQNGLMFDQETKQVSTSKWNSARLGADFFLNDKNTIGVLVNGSYANGANRSKSRAEISTLSRPGTVDSLLIAETDDQSERPNLNTNINYRYQDTSGHSLNVDVDYGVFRMRSDIFQPNYYRSADELQPLRTAIAKFLTPVDIDIFTAKTDYEQRLWKGTLGIGAKMANVATDNTFEQYVVEEGKETLDRDRSNRFEYTERTLAAYVNYNRMFFKKLNVQAGLRLENTHYMGDLTTYNTQRDTTIENDYTKLFPSAALTYSFTDKIGLNATYSRRIDRPSYQDLNPFVFRLDELTYQQGNERLVPQFTNSFEIAPTYSGYPVVSFGYSKTNDVFTQILAIAADNPKATYIKQENLADQENMSLTMNFPTPFAKWYDGFVSITGFRSHFTSERLGIDQSFRAMNLYAEQNIKLPKGFGIQLSGWYNSPAFWGTLRSTRQGSMDLGFQKKLWDGKGELRLRFGDILRTAGWGGNAVFVPGLDMTANGTWEARTTTLNFSYRFGSSDVKAARQRKTGLEDEKNRVKGK
jgi:iron complex outermembrane recepter protein